MIRANLLMALLAYGVDATDLRAHVTRLGASGTADAISVSASITQNGSSLSTTAIWFRVGRVFTTGTAQLRIVSYDDLPIASGTAVVMPDAWVRWAAPTPVLIDAIKTVDIAGGSAEFELFNGETGTAYARSTRTGSYEDVAIRPYMVTLFATDGGVPGAFYGGSLLFELNTDDPWAATTCGSVPLVAGFPYVDVVDDAISDGTSLSVGTGVLLHDEGYLSYGLSSFALDGVVDDGGIIQFEVTFAGRLPQAGVLQPESSSHWHGTTPFGFPFFGFYDGGLTPFSLKLTPVGGGLVVRRLTSGVPSDPCHPAVRATWGSSFAQAGNDPGSDLLITYDNYCTINTVYRDRDKDGFGDPSTGFDVCDLHPGFVFNGSDCDDTSVNVKPAALEICDGIDNDCDGLIDAVDPDLMLPPCEKHFGLCVDTQRDVRTCAGGHVRACGSESYGPFYESVETSCDGRDNDCDGMTDEVSYGTLCANQVGVCQGAHATVCSLGRWGDCGADDYGPHYEAHEQSCDGLDNDCDGLTDGDDEDVMPGPCGLQVGVCADSLHARAQCTAIGWLGCDAREYGALYQQVELSCDGQDNDCDGDTDEGCGPKPRCSTAPGLSAAAALLLLLRRRLRATSCRR